MTRHTKPVRLEINTNGAWKVIGRFDAADTARCYGDILDAAERLATALAEHGTRITLLVSMANAPHSALMHWTDAESGWRDPITGDPA